MVKQGKPNLLNIDSQKESEITISWDWNPSFDLPIRFVIFNRIRNNNHDYSKVGEVSITDIKFTFKNLQKSTDYEFGIGADYLGGDNPKNLFVVLATTTAFIFASTLTPTPIPQPQGTKPPEIPSLVAVNVSPKTLRKLVQIAVRWNTDNVSDHYNLRYYEVKTSIPENAVQIDFEAKDGFHVFEGFFIPNGTYRMSMQGCNQEHILFIGKGSVCSNWSNQIDVEIPPLIKSLRLFLGDDSKRGLRGLLSEFNKSSVLGLLRD